MLSFNSFLLFYFTRWGPLNHGNTTACCFSTKPPHMKDQLASYLMGTLKLSSSQAHAISNRFPRPNYTQKAQAVLQYLQELGFSNAQIRSSVVVCPQILFADIDKTLKPKLDFFQHLGLVRADLGNYISKSATVLTLSLKKRLVPSVQILKRILYDDKDNRVMIKVLQRCKWILSKSPESVLLPNIARLESYGITGSQLSLLLKLQPNLFVVKSSVLDDIISRAIQLGISRDSGMFVHAVHTVSCISVKTFQRKLELFRGFGFSEDECLLMVRRSPGLLRVSEEKLKVGLNFLLNSMELQRTLIVNFPCCLSFSMEQRVAPRFRVLQVLKLKGLLKRDPGFTNMLSLTEEEFVERFIARYRDDTEQLLMAYKGHILDVCEKQEFGYKPLSVSHKYS